MNNNEFKEKFLHKMDHNGHRAMSVVGWTLAAIFIGITVGLFATGFGLSMRYVIGFREAHKWLIFLLPVGAVFITFMYKQILKEKDSGTNTVIAAI